ncbi:uncharacterized protein LOC126367809 [Pectinophora gossypiella]|nr:uncharacterized protein LOC126367809 [Pectinophora gossypiella]
MRFDKCALLCAILALSILEPIAARKGFGFSGGRSHSYPKSGGLSGGHSGSHSYPSSGGGLSGGSHGYPSSGTGSNHGYPSSGGLSGSGQRHPSSGHSYPSSGGSHTYPQSGGSHGYPSSGSGLSGNSRPSGTTNVHHHYHYSPPQQISYVPHRGAAPVSYPVYHGTPPTYVYQYKDSGSKYGTLLAGLALLNLGALAGTAYAVSHANSGHSSYKPQPGEVCKFGVRRSNNDYEETRIDCQLITSFIFQEEAKTQAQAAHNSTTITTTTTVTNVTMMNNTNPVNPVSAPVNQTAVKVLYEMLPNGTLVPVNVTVNATENATSSPVANNNVPSSVSVTTTTTNTTVTNALDVKGKPIDVTPDMQCYVIRTSPSSNMRRSVPCGLLQTYAEKSITRNSGVRSLPTFAILTVVFAVLVLN